MHIKRIDYAGPSTLLVEYSDGHVEFFDFPFNPYFYVRRSDKKELLGLWRHKARYIVQIYDVDRVTVYGEPVAKVEVKHPLHVKVLRDIAHKHGVPTYESDILYLDNVAHHLGYQYSFDPGDILYFDIEVDWRRGLDAPLSGKNRILAISYADRNGLQGVFWDDDERVLLDKFASLLSRYKVLAGYNIYGFDVPILEKRAQLHGVTLPKVHVFDLYPIFKKGRSELVSARLDDVALDYLGVGKSYHYSSGEEMWEDFVKKDKRLYDYVLQDAVLCRMLDAKFTLFEQSVELLNLAGLTDFKNLNFVSRIVSSILVKAYRRRGMVFPSMKQRANGGEMYTGAYVFDPVPGLHENVAVFDFKSLYPSIISTFNVSIETLDDEGEIRTEVKRFTVEPEGVYREVLGWLGDLRSSYKKKMLEAIGKGNVEKVKEYDVKQYVVKVVMNSFYGYIGLRTSPVYNTNIAESITKTGQRLIQKVAEISEKLGNPVLYGDSVSGDSRIPVRFNGRRVSVVTVRDLFEMGKRVVVGVDGREYALLSGVETLASDLEGNVEWKPLRKVMRHKVNKKCYSVGRSKWRVTVTEDHSLIGYVDGALREVKPLELRGVKLLGLRKSVVRSTGAPLCAIKLWEFIGAMIGNGYWGCNHVTCENYVYLSTGKDREEYIEKLLKPLRECGVIRNYYLKNEKGDITVYSPYLARLMRLFKDGKNKIVPEWLYSAPKEIIAAFLRGYFSTDGTVYIRNSRPIIRLSTVRWWLAERVRDLLFLIGVPASVFTGSTVNTYNGKSSGTRNVYVHVADRETFMHEVGFLLERKAQRVNVAVKQNMTYGDLWLVRSVNVEPVPCDDYVYDLVVDDHHTFFANWFLVHNTDSIFVQLKSSDFGDEIRELDEVLNGELRDWVVEYYNVPERYYNLRIRGEKVYRRIFFPGVKKHYIGYLSWLEGEEVDKLVVAGLPLKKGDTPGFMKRVMEIVYRGLLDGVPVSEIRRRVNEVVVSILDGTIDPRELVYKKTVHKSPKDAGNNQPFFRAAAKLEELGLFYPGLPVEYVWVTETEVEPVIGDRIPQIGPGGRRRYASIVRDFMRRVLRDVGRSSLEDFV